MPAGVWDGDLIFVTTLLALECLLVIGWRLFGINATAGRALRAASNLRRNLKCAAAPYLIDAVILVAWLLEECRMLPSCEEMGLALQAGAALSTLLSAGTACHSRMTSPKLSSQGNVVEERRSSHGLSTGSSEDDAESPCARDCRVSPALKTALLAACTIASMTFFLTTGIMWSRPATPENGRLLAVALMHLVAATTAGAIMHLEYGDEMAALDGRAQTLLAWIHFRCRKGPAVELHELDRHLERESPRALMQAKEALELEMTVRSTVEALRWASILAVFGAQSFVISLIPEQEVHEVAESVAVVWSSSVLILLGLATAGPPVVRAQVAVAEPALEPSPTGLIGVLNRQGFPNGNLPIVNRRVSWRDMAAPTPRRDSSSPRDDQAQRVQPVSLETTGKEDSSITRPDNPAE
jgi:hypothetical protein